MGIISVRPSVIVIHKNKLLVVHSTYNNEEYYLLPGGGIEGKETIFECAIRETKEETGAVIEIIKVAYLNDYLPADGRCLNIYLLGNLVSGEEVSHLKDPDISKGKIKKAEWISLDKIKDIDFRPKELVKRILMDAPLFNNSNNYFKD